MLSDTHNTVVYYLVMKLVVDNDIIRPGSSMKRTVSDILLLV